MKGDSFFYRIDPKKSDIFSVRPKSFIKIGKNQKMSFLRGSANFVWCTTSVLGKGATGAVFQGVNKVYIC